MDDHTHTHQRLLWHMMQQRYEMAYRFYDPSPPAYDAKKQSRQTAHKRVKHVE